MVAAKETGMSIFELLPSENRPFLKLNAGTSNRLENLHDDKSFQILAKRDAFVLTEHVIKKSGLVLEMKKDGTPEGIARLENLEELLNGIQDFVEGQREIDKVQVDY